MNKLIISLIVIAVVACAVLFYVSSSGKEVYRTGPAQNAQTFYVKGIAQVKRGADASWEDVGRDMKVEDGYLVSTAAKSSVEIKFGKDEKNIIACSEDTSVELTKIATEGDKAVDLKKGKLLSLVKGLDADSKFQVKTPTAVCGVTGTGFEAEGDDSKTTVKVYEGTVNAKSANSFPALSSKEVPVKEGEMTVIEKSKPPQQPTPLSEEDMEKWNAWKGDLDGHLFRTFYVFTDEDDLQNHYSPSGWVGDYDAIRRESWPEGAQSGKDCLKFKYTGRTPQGAGWVGVYWLNPVNNWGDVKGGYSLKGATKLTFWAKGEKGGEVIMRFGMGGIGGQYPDSCKAEIGPIVLENEWKQYTIELEDKDLSYISGGFYWMTDKASNPDGAVFFIDEIRYE